MCVGIGRILDAGRSVRTRMVACLSVLFCSNAWHKPSMAIGAVFTFLSSVKVLHPLLRCRFLKLCLALVTVVESVFRRADVGIKR